MYGTECRLQKTHLTQKNRLWTSNCVLLLCKRFESCTARMNQSCPEYRLRASLDVAEGEPIIADACRHASQDTLLQRCLQEGHPSMLFAVVPGYERSEGPEGSMGYDQQEALQLESADWYVLCLPIAALSSKTLQAQKR